MAMTNQKDIFALGSPKPGVHFTGISCPIRELLRKVEVTIN